MPPGSPEPLDVAFGALARRDLSVRELDKRLARRGVEEPDRREVIERLAAQGYVDDGRFALARARSLAERGLGDAAISADLEQRGVAPAVVEEAIAALRPEPERARVQAARLGGGVRALRALARKGFGADSLEAAARVDAVE